MSGSNSIGVNTGGPAQTLLTQMQNAIDSGNAMNKALSTASGQIPTAWSGPAANNWLTEAQSNMKSLASFIQDTINAKTSAQSYINNIATAGGGSGVH